MEPRNDESQKVPEPRKEERKLRFQIVKLEERIAPAKGGNHTQRGNCLGHTYGGCYHYSRGGGRC